ncbi:hypothetical protein AAG570_010891 [Ranatra chinensis]|uniref:Uncharacterized protein n=1 Tax=Ranatra chinensis TaxID=642074 RepID=A0ABD0Z5B6_9HEMI
MASKRRYMFNQNKKQETTEIGFLIKRIGLNLKVWIKKSSKIQQGCKSEERGLTVRQMPNPNLQSEISEGSTRSANTCPADKVSMGSRQQKPVLALPKLDDLFARSPAYLRPSQKRWGDPKEVAHK